MGEDLGPDRMLLCLLELKQKQVMELRAELEKLKNSIAALSCIDYIEELPLLSKCARGNVACDLWLRGQNPPLPTRRDDKSWAAAFKEHAQGIAPDTAVTYDAFQELMAAFAWPILTVLYRHIQELQANAGPHKR